MGLVYETKLLIDGELVPAEGGATFVLINPATEEVIGEAADASLADVERAIAAARRCATTRQPGRRTRSSVRRASANSPQRCATTLRTCGR